MRKKKGKKDCQPSRKAYERPALTEFGSVRQFTRSVSVAGMSDGGGLPNAFMSMCIGPISALEEHRHLIGDRTCQDSYRAAILATVKPGEVVLDLGTGSGIHALFACQAGASRVYAIDADTVIALARDTARENGFADRIQFLYGASTEVELPEKVDVLISNIGFLGSLQSLPDACRRFLKPGGRAIPGSVELAFVPVTASSFYRDHVDAWQDTRYGLRFSAFRPYAASHAHISHFTQEDNLAKPRMMSKIDLSRELPEFFRWQTEFTVERDGMLHGLAGWYGFELGAGVRISTQPPLTLSPQVWFHPFLPLTFPREVRRGMRIAADIGFYLVDSGYQPVWRWRLDIDGMVSDQSSFDSIPLERRFLEKLRH